jgi:hypothetical protein
MAPALAGRRLSRTLPMAPTFNFRATTSKFPNGSRYIASARSQQKTPFPEAPPLMRRVFVVAETCLRSRCLATDQVLLYVYQSFA